MQIKSLKHGFFAVRLMPGEELISQLIQFGQNYVKGCAFFWGIGGVKSVSLYHLNLGSLIYRKKTITQDLEIASLTGNITMSSKKICLVHAHGVFGDLEMQALAGHVAQATIQATTELLIATFDVQVKRMFDQKTGLDLWRFSHQTKE